MNLKNNLSKFICLFYIGFHLIYSLYMFTQAYSYGAIWLGFALIEVGIFYLGKIKWNKLWTILSCVLVLQSVLSFGIVVCSKSSDIQGADSVLVLGYQLSNNEMSETLKYRLDEAYDYAVNNPNSRLVLCGGVTRENTVSEAEVMKEYLLELGLHENRIYCEDESTNTIENIQNSFAYVDADSKIIVLSSNYHVIRARMICEKAGLDVKILGSKAPFLLIPNQCFFEKISMLRLLLNI